MDDRSRQYVFPDGHGGPLVRWQIVDGAVFKNGSRVLTLTRVRQAAINNLNGRVRVREVRLRLDDDQGVSFGSYSASAFSATAGGYEGFKREFFAALAVAAPDVPVDTEAAVLPKFSLAVLILAIGLLCGTVGASTGNVFVMAAALAIVGFATVRAYKFRPWDAGRLQVRAADFASAGTNQHSHS